MKAIYNLIQIKRQYKNNGQHLEQTARFNLTGRIEKADNKPFWLEADCLNIQIKSPRATVCKGLDIDEHLRIDKAEKYGFVTKNGQTMYIMSKTEYKAFVTEFQTIDRESSKNGGVTKIRLKDESQAMRQYLQERV